MSANVEHVRVVTLIEVIRLLRRMWLFIVGGALAGLVVALAIGFIMKPVYRSTVVVMPISSEDSGGGGLSAMMGQLGGLGGLIGLPMSGGGNATEAMAVLNSQRFAQQIISEEKMMNHFFAEKWDAVRGEWDVADQRDVPTAWDAWEIFNNEVRSVFDDTEHGLIAITIEWTDRELAAHWANLIAARVDDELRARKLAQLDRSLQYLNEKLENADVVELRTAISKVMEAQISERMLVSVRDEFAYRVIDPAVVADEDRPVRPKRIFLAVIAIVIGGGLGLAIGLMRDYILINSDLNPSG